MAGVGQQNGTLAELERVLRRFQLRHMPEHVLPELDSRWEWALREMKRSQLPVRPSTLAMVLRERVRRQGFDEGTLKDLINTLSLKCVALNEVQEWHAFTLQERSVEDEPVRTLVALTPHRVQRALREAFARKELTVEVDSALVGEWLHMALRVERSGAERRPLHVAALPAASYVFVSRRSVPARVLKALALGLGYSGAESAALCGRHLESLLRVLQQRINGSARELLPPARFEPRPLRTRHGVDCTGDAYAEHYAGEMLGAEPPRLQLLAAQAEQPLGLEADAPPVRTRLRIESDDVARVLRDLVRIKAIAGNSKWLSGFRSTSTNVMELEDDE